MESGKRDNNVCQLREISFFDEKNSDRELFSDFGLHNRVESEFSLFPRNQMLYS